MDNLDDWFELFSTPEMSNIESEGSAVVVRSGGRQKFAYKAEQTTMVTDGYMSLKSAQDVLTEVMADWGFTSQRDSDIEPIVGKIAHALRQGTSGERNYKKVWFLHNGVECVLEALKVAAGKRDDSENPVRVWTRSYKSAEIPVRIYDMLSDPENVSLREEAAYDYGCSLDVVHVSFDTADALPKFKGFKFTQVERFVAKTNTANKVRSSRSTHIGGTDGGTVQDAAAHASSIEATAPVQQTSAAAGIMPTASRNRANFAPVR